MTMFPTRLRPRYPCTGSAQRRISRAGNPFFTVAVQLLHTWQHLTDEHSSDILVEVHCWIRFEHDNSLSSLQSVQFQSSQFSTKWRTMIQVACTPTAQQRNKLNVESWDASRVIMANLLLPRKLGRKWIYHLIASQKSCQTSIVVFCTDKRAPAYPW